MRALAAELGLVVTGSIDFHGTHKTVRLGAFTTSVEAYERIVAAGGDRGRFAADPAYRPPRRG